MQSKNVIFAASCLVFSIVFTALLLLSPTGVQATGGDDHKVKICHATSADNNPYTSNNIDVSSVFTEGHDGHTGPIWFPGITVNWGDIIPPFSYETKVCPPNDSTLYTEGNCKDKDKNDCSIGSNNDKKCAAFEVETKTYPGKNLTAVGREILKDKDCDYSKCSVKVETGETVWGDWIINPENQSKIIRYGTIALVDALYPSYSCGTKPVNQTENRPLCEWNSEYYADEEECAEIEMCEYNIEIPATDPECKGPEEPAVCIYNPQILATDPLCVKPEEPKVCVYNPQILATDPLCVKPKDTVVEEDEPSVLGATTTSTTTVVHAPTAGEDNVLIYFIEIALITLTSISLVHISKDYLNRN